MLFEFLHYREGEAREEEKKSIATAMKIPETKKISKEPETAQEDNKEIDFSNFMCKAIGVLGEHHKEAKNWKQKLELVKNVLENIELENNELAAVGGYLQLINNGQIVCEESGPHFRPTHHAKLALDIHTHLVKKISKENSFLIKIILKNLPSFSSKFRSDVPLARIRDIAHRNDIPPV